MSQTAWASRKVRVAMGAEPNYTAQTDKRILAVLDRPVIGILSSLRSNVGEAD